MLRIACESCRAPYQVDERRVPAAGLKMRCPKCGHSFVVRATGETGAIESPAAPAAKPTPAAPAAPPTAAKSNKSTMVGVQAPPIPAKPPAKDPPSASKLTKPDLPRAKTEPLPKAPPKPPPPPPKKAEPKDEDLPAVAGARPAVADLPAAKPVGRPATRPATIAATTPGTDLGSTELDLPAPRPAATKTMSFDTDLPAPAAAKFDTDLPAPAPAKKAPAAESPMADDPFGGGLDSFGELDLPSMGEDLPSVAHQLPAVAAALPATVDALPAVASALPAVAGVLPAVANALPAKVDALPAVANALPAKAEVLPSAKSSAFSGGGSLEGDPFASATSTKVTEEPAPGASPAQFDGFDDLDGFGAAVLGATKASKPESSAQGDDLAFGSTMAAGKKVSVPPTNAGGADDALSFGEVDLGGASPEESASGSELQLGGTAAAEGTELALPVQSTITQAGTRTRAQPTAAPKKKSRAPAVFVGFVLVAAAAGAALHFTPYGAFGRFVISDNLHKGEYEAAAKSLGESTRAKSKSDVFPDVRAATEDAAREHARLPRANGVASYAAIAEFLAQLRFGRVPERAARAKLWLQEQPVSGKENPYAPIARALQLGLDQDLTGARTGLEMASKGPASSLIGEEIAIGRGEIELRLRNAQEALQAFGAAAALSDSARAHFGLARAHALLDDVEATRKEIDATFKLSPAHVSAHILRANILWDFDRDETAALAELAKIIDAGATIAPDDLAGAYAERGWVHLSKGRAGEARAAFEAGLKVAPSSSRALLGLGELLFNEGRNSEALARFDLALQGDMNNPAAIVASAKGKMMLERLQDAKNQLVAARELHPTNWRIPYWLARTEHVLGNQEAAEKEFLNAIQRVNPKHPDAILPYASLASFLAERGRAKEAAAKLEEAQKRLPDSALMQRALGDVALAEGSFDRAVAHFQASIAKEPQDPNPHFRLATTYRRMKKITEAQEELAKVEELDKEFPSLIVERGLLFEASGEVDKALAQFKRALDKAPDNVELQLRVGFAYVSIDRADDAVQILHKVWEKRQDSAQVNHALGRAIMAQSESKIPEALRHLKRSVELDSTNAEYHLYVAIAANDAMPAQLGLAHAEIDKAFAIDPQLPEAFWQRGSLLRKEGRVDDAIRDVKKAIELKPTRLEAYATLAECYDDKNEDALAVEAWRKALELRHPRAYWRYRYAKHMMERKQLGEVAAQMTLALPIGESYDPPPGWLGDAEFIAGEAFRMTGKKKEAIAAYRRFLQLSPSSPDRRDAVAALEAWGEKLN